MKAQRGHSPQTNSDLAVPVCHASAAKMQDRPPLRSGNFEEATNERDQDRYPLHHYELLHKLRADQPTEQSGFKQVSEILDENFNFL